MEKTRNIKDRESGRVIGGLILVAVGAALLLRNLGFFMPVWLFTWPVILIIVGGYIGIKSNFRNNAWFILMILGGYFLVNRFIPSLNLEPLFWPMMIMAVGLAFILRPHRGRWTNNSQQDEINPANISAAGFEHQGGPMVTDSTDYLSIKSVFSGVNKKLVSKNFQGGHISCVFGGSEVDLSQADLHGPATIKLEIIFGGAKLILPPHWTVQNQIDGFFHGVDDKRSFNPSAATNPEKLLILKGSAVFGGVEIRNY
jgi:hypothetical protein